MAVMCLSCNKPFPDFKELALHISTTRKGHRKGKKWAAKYLMKVNSLNKPNLSGATKLSEEDKQNRKSIIREISGEEETVLTICPQCKRGHRESLPIEYIRSAEAWHSNKCLVLLCSSCKGHRGNIT